MTLAAAFHKPASTLIAVAALSSLVAPWPNRAAAQSSSAPRTSSGINARAHAHASVPDAAFTRDFAVPWQDTPAHATSDNEVGRENALNGDPRFAVLLRSAFHQKQWFWLDHYRFTPLPDLIETFIGVPGSAILDEGRYVTLDGCVPHDCTDRGMLWIDSESQPASLIFAATRPVNGDGPAGDHLWLFSSVKLNWQHLPPSFLVSLPRWFETIGKPGYSGTSGYRFDFVLATIVQPNGIMEDLSPATLHLRNTQTGAQQ
jgi:hypothetical protein